ncbi:hypothetical protein CROQUDRAFT_654661 [Cronartium quercuum f. sp. fusiforme G11]|uniref:Uncharacterized protein n=1 Tax=Cronartium quercuum f. sp. fusiforme G11 TaxID=708437 RepID=A0A9P6NQU3_9BASI|nr:hypothetical protein CROQUDRAFT_654661 [Cronartium quercuum f. sp. fusiforme G11]
MSTVRAAMLTSLGIVSVGFLLGQYLQPEPSPQVFLATPEPQPEENYHGRSSAELRNRLDNLKAMQRKLDAERAIALNKLVEVDKRLGIASPIDSK